jgi:hypothetical protein
MSLLERALVVIAAVLAVASLALAVDLDIGRNPDMPVGSIVDQRHR